MMPYVDRDQDGRIVGIYALSQYDGQEYVDGETQLYVDMQSAVVAAVQKRLDDFARTRNYDGILSACTYATSNVTKFQIEGRYCVAARDAHWSKCYDLLTQVHGGAPVPTVDEVIAQMPALEWP
jgi:hypothetical protein